MDEATIAAEKDPDKLRDALMNLRIAFREDGALYCAYLADQASMVGAKLLCSMPMDSAKQSSRAYQLFSALAQVLAAVEIQKLGGTIQAWREPERAPEHARTRGNG